MFDINGGEFAILLVVALLVVGPERLPEFARQARGAIARVRALVREGTEAVRSEVGDTEELSSLDPRQFHPRRIVADVLGTEPVSERARPSSEGRAARRAAASLDAGQRPPVDLDAT